MNNIHLCQKSKITKENIGRSKPPSGPHSSDIQFTTLIGRVGTAEGGAGKYKLYESLHAE